MTNSLDREAVAEPHNLLGIDGIEFIEFATSKPQALGGVLERMGFRPVARHRSYNAAARARASDRLPGGVKSSRSWISTSAPLAVIA